VRNRVDGTVEAEIEGEQEVVGTVIELLHARNSPYIRVDKITANSREIKNDSGFEIR
jgi:acylphosphatase